MTMVCVRCMVADRPGVPAVGTDRRCNSVCLEHLAESWTADHLCQRCKYWVATRDSLCDSCAEDVALKERGRR